MDTKAISAVLNRAADLIEEQGWQQYGRWYSPDEFHRPQFLGGFSALEAICEARGGWCPEAVHWLMQEVEITSWVDEHGSERLPGERMGVIGWEIHPDRTQEEVVSALRRAAENIQPWPPHKTVTARIYPVKVKYAQS